MNLNAKKILNRKVSSKHDLRMALAQVLGVECPQFDAPKSYSTDQCKRIFFDFFEEKTGLDYSWSGKDGLAMEHIIKKIRRIAKSTGEQAVVDSFNYILVHLPEWYQKNGLSLTIINSKFNEIIASIKNEQLNKTGKSKVSDSYKRSILRDLQS